MTRLPDPFVSRAELRGPGIRRDDLARRVKVSLAEVTTMPRKILITPDPKSRLSPEPYYIDVYDFSVVVPRRDGGITFLQVDGPLPEDAANAAVGLVGPDVKEFFLSSRPARFTAYEHWRVRVEDGRPVAVEKTEKTFKTYDELIASNLKEEFAGAIAALKKIEKKALRSRPK
jgi:hypothetical protein